MSKAVAQCLEQQSISDEWDELAYANQCSTVAILDQNVFKLYDAGLNGTT